MELMVELASPGYANAAVVKGRIDGIPVMVAVAVMAGGVPLPIVSPESLTLRFSIVIVEFPAGTATPANVSTMPVLSIVP